MDEAIPNKRSVPQSVQRWICSSIPFSYPSFAVPGNSDEEWGMLSTILSIICHIFFEWNIPHRFSTVASGLLGWRLHMRPLDALYYYTGTKRFPFIKTMSSGLRFRKCLRIFFQRTFKVLYRTQMRRLELFLQMLYKCYIFVMQSI